MFRFLILFPIFYAIACAAQPTGETEKLLRRFVDLNPETSFVVKTEWSGYDTLSFAALKPYADRTREFPVVADKPLVEVTHEPMGMIEETEGQQHLRGGLYVDEKLKYVVYFDNRIFYVFLNMENNRVEGISAEYKGMKGNQEILNLGFSHNNDPTTYHFQASRASQDWETINYSLLENKKIDFSKGDDGKYPTYANDLNLANQMRDFALALLVYHKNKNCPTSDFLAEGPFFTSPNLNTLNAHIDSLFGDMEIRFPGRFKIPTETMVLRVNVINHPKDGRLYVEGLPQIVQGKPAKLDENYHRLCANLMQSVEALLASKPLPTRYCLPIRYRKDMFFYWKNGRVVEVTE